MRKTYRQLKNHCQNNKLWLSSLLPVNVCEVKRGYGESNRDYCLRANTNFMSGWPSPNWCWISFFFFLFPVELTFEAGPSWAACAELVPARRQLARISPGASLGSRPWESAVQLGAPCPPHQPGKTPLAGMRNAAWLLHAKQVRLTHRKQDFWLGIGLFKADFSFQLLSLHNGQQHFSP